MTDAVDLDDLVEDELDRAWLHGRLFSGVATETYANGVTATLTTYVDGYETGPQRMWRNDGSLEFEATLLRGNGVGRALQWHRSGALAEEMVFDERGNPRSRRRWDEGGRLVDETSWEHIFGSSSGGTAAAAGR